MVVVRCWVWSGLPTSALGRVGSINSWVWLGWVLENESTAMSGVAFVIVKLVTWLSINELYQANNMQINKQKTKEMVITSSHAVSLPFIPNIERVESDLTPRRYCVK